MSTLVDLAISAHGGMDRRKRLSTVSAHPRVGGALWALTGKEAFMGDVDFEAELHRELRATLPPTIALGVTDRMRIAHEEIFGPVLPIVP
jgi:hypothetical protein